MDLWVVNDTIRRSKRCGMFRALPQSEVSGSGSVLTSFRLLAKGGCPVGVWNRMGGPSRPGIRPFGIDRMTARAIGAVRGAGKPRWVRTLANTEGCSMAAMIFKGPPQWGQCSISILNTRVSSRAQLRRAGAAGGASPGSAEGVWALSGTHGKPGTGRSPPRENGETGWARTHPGCAKRFWEALRRVRLDDGIRVLILTSWDGVFAPAAISRPTPAFGGFSRTRLVVPANCGKTPTRS